MIRLWAIPLNLQKTYKQNLDCFQFNETIPSCTAVSHFPQLLGQGETTSDKEIQAPVVAKMKNQCLR